MEFVQLFLMYSGVKDYGVCHFLLGSSGDLRYDENYINEYGYVR